MAGADGHGRWLDHRPGYREFLLNDDIPRFDEIAEWCYTATGRYRAGFKKEHVGDQGIVNLVPHVFCGGWTEMDLIYNTTSMKMNTMEKPVILHCTGGPKPWCRPGDAHRSRAVYREQNFALWHQWSDETKEYLGLCRQ